MTRVTVIKLAVRGTVIILTVWFIVIMLSGCATPKQVARMHATQHVADSLSVKAMMDKHSREQTVRMDSIVKHITSSQVSDHQGQEHQQEVTTETITTITDSLGRQIRTEQRTVSRDLQREWRQHEEQLREEWQQEINYLLTVRDSEWQARFDELRAHIEARDTIGENITPVNTKTDNRPWYKRISSAIGYIVIGIACGVIIYIKRKSIFCS